MKRMLLTVLIMLGVTAAIRAGNCGIASSGGGSGPVVHCPLGDGDCDYSTGICGGE